MGAKDWFVAYADDGTDPRAVLVTRPTLDREATADLVRRLHPGRPVEALPDSTLGEGADPDDGEVYAAVWPGLSIVCTSDAAGDRPSALDPKLLREGAGRRVYVHAMHSVVDWFAYGVWAPDGTLRRALSASADHEVIEDVGERLPFEEPFWGGRFPATEDGDHRLPFHPLELSEAALDTLFGFVFEGWSGMGEGLVDPFDVPLAGYRLGAAPTGRRGLFRRR